MYKAIVTIVCCLVLCAGCTKESKYRAKDSTITFTVGKPKALKSNYLGTISDSLGIPAAIALVHLKSETDEYAVIADRTGHPPLHYVNLTKDNYITGIGRTGRGPGDFGAISSIYTVGPGKVLVTDTQNLRLIRIDLNSLSYSGDSLHYTYDTINLKFRGLPFDIFPLKNGNYAAVGPLHTPKNKTFAILDSAGNQLKLAGAIPNYDKSAPASVNQLSWRSYAAPKPDGNMFAVGYYNTDLIELYDKSGNLIERIEGPDFKQIEYEYSQKYNGLVMKENTIRSYISLTSTQDYFYALYSGVNINEKNSNFGNFVYKFNWDGKLIQSYKLDHAAFKIVVNEKKLLLYSLANYSIRPGIYKYKLNK